MLKQITALLIGVVLLAGCGTGSQSADRVQSKQKVVYHMNYDDLGRQASALRNIQNHINAVGAESLDIRVVLHGRGVSVFQHAFTDEKIQSRLVTLRQQDVAFNVCQSTLTRQGIDYRTDLFGVTATELVPSGVAELARLQAEGYTYIKP